MKTENISEEMIERLYWAAVHFRDFIAMQPNASPVIWCGDRKSWVVNMPHYKSACEAVREFEMKVYGKKPRFRLIFMGSKIPDFENSEKEDELFLKKLESMRWTVPSGGGSKA
ncbi:hypothetical protein LZ24_02505 [Desulfobotulus alkaliphilus]|uniref:Uncharacterized protein n=1 Tax=Desulfobotulus alkaliphilus TaxID=622671 RepID=A0A562RI16_9BACT|nr:hypothetical protein [Desulfobotulus alkaliphilus]TWI68533.1 hypothetical protein LZ24_02505 [Desulfobotulus alkaliphilus]